MEPVKYFPYNYSDRQNGNVETREVLFEKIPFVIRLDPESRRFNMAWYSENVQEKFKVKCCTDEKEINKAIAATLHFSEFYVIMEGENKGRGILKLHRKREDII